MKGKKFMPDKSTTTQTISQDGTFLMTPTQHRAMAWVVRSTTGKKGGPSKERGKQMAANHEAMARLIGKRDWKNLT
jgi:hypothetical protein